MKALVVALGLAYWLSLACSVIPLVAWDIAGDATQGLAWPVRASAYFALTVLALMWCSLLVGLTYVAPLALFGVLGVDDLP